MHFRQPSGRPGLAICQARLQGIRPHRSWHGLHTCMVVVAATVCAVRPAAAQAGAPAGGAQASGAAVVQAMTNDLRRVVSANEVYRAKNKRYAASVADLPGYQASSGVTVTFTAATATGWSGKATAATLPGKSCVVSVGPVASPPKTDATGRTGADAVVVCDPA
jgi:hypothetical protein